ncbi:AraC family transcriptional regulator ligand-binding domain-containing protein [Curvibacter sp. APW13]|uniref:AraC family transcriptional regulator ligand-binding domain-containing protein n=1 Tax=Curvibacter sp. APW13 TaxID=3077236 RepID=UPI0028DFB4BB|nr:AraC family transcriptional regulator ligand-binding domain-containing protein [Curvibacter sp. APW13]MDT8991599.1 AraC family transcriptional regulator ligand-binding domain-containing protein [Curvibacter sp. APW13]
MQHSIDWDYGLRPLQQYLAQHAPHLHPPAGLNSEQLYAWLARHTAEATQGLQVGQCYRITDYGPVSLAMLCAQDLGQAVQVVAAHLLEFNSHLARFDMSHQAGETVVEVQFRPDVLIAEAVLRFHANVMAAATLRLVADLVGERRCLRRLVLPLQPANPDFEAFFRVPVALQGAGVRFHFEGDVLQWPIPTANAATFEAALQACGSQLGARLEQALGGTAQRVAQLLGSCAHALPNMEAAAAHLHLCERTLRRRLAAEGTTYRALLDDAQWRRASVLLAQPGATVPYVAGQLGIANPATLRALLRRRAQHPQTSVD